MVHKTNGGPVSDAEIAAAAEAGLITIPDKPDAHTMKIATNALVKQGEAANIPVFTAFRDPKAGYVYNALFPEEIDDPAMEKDYGKFTRFLKVCSDFNKEDFRPSIRIDDSED